ncbi:zinc finger, CCHC-type containing protein, partial [Tanacetum coccineum]
PMASALYSLSSKLKDTIRGNPSNDDTKGDGRRRYTSCFPACVWLFVLTTPIPEDGENATMEQVKLCDSLEAKYMADDGTSKKFLVSNFTNYKMTDSRPVMEQYNELLGILGRFTQHKMNMDEAIQVSFPQVQDNDKPKGNNVPLVFNMTEHNNSLRPGHLKKDCNGGNLATSPMVQAQMDDDVVWWVNSGKTMHVYKDRCWFKTYESLNDGSILYMENESTILVHGRGCIDLRFSSRKIVSLFNVLHVPKFKKNLVSSSILNNYGYKQVIESIKFVLSKHSVFTGFGYLCNQMFRLNIFNDNVALAFMSTSKLNDLILWHARLGHIHFKRMQDMSKDELIPAFDMDTEKTESKVLGTIVRLPDPKLKTLGERGIECIFVGYAKHFKTFRIYVIEPNESGFRQKSGIDNFDTYAPAVRISVIRLLIAMTSIHNLIIPQIDVKTTFLNGKLDEEGPKQWYKKFDEVVLSSDYLTKLTNVFMIKEFLSLKLSMKDMGEADVILGKRIKSERNGITNSESHYIEKILKKFSYFDCTPMNTPIDISEKLIPNDVGKLSRYISNPSTQHCSTMESKFVALAAAGKEAKWLRNLNLKIPLWSKLIAPISICCDSSYIGKGL